MKLDMTRVDGWADGPALCEPAVPLGKLKPSNVVRCAGCGTEMILFEAPAVGDVQVCSMCEPAYVTAERDARFELRALSVDPGAP